jgi:hypothetical protein
MTLNEHEMVPFVNGRAQEAGANESRIYEIRSH